MIAEGAVVRVHSLGVSALIALMVSHRQEARSMGVRRTAPSSTLPDDDCESTGDERADRQSIGAFQIFCIGGPDD